MKHLGGGTEVFSDTLWLPWYRKHQSGDPIMTRLVNMERDDEVGNWAGLDYRGTDRG